MGDSNEKLLSITSSLRRLIECQICLDTVKLPFKLCTSGHLICTKCIRSLKKCPTCQAMFSLENPVCVKNLLEAIPRFCKYSEQGCKEVVEFGENHEAFCGFRLVSCREHNCSVKMPGCKMERHYDAQHFTKVYCPDVCTALASDAGFNLQDKKPNFVPVTCFKNFGWIKKINNVNDRYVKLTFYVVPLGKPDIDYFMCISFEKGEVKFTSTIKAFLIGSDDKLHSDASATSNDAANALACDDPEFCMKVPHHALSHFIEDGVLTWKFGAFKLPKKSE